MGDMPALGEAYAKALGMLSPERRKVWAGKIAQSQQPNRAKTRPLARGAIRASTNRLPLAR
jgi:hypothetical protein